MNMNYLKDYFNDNLSLNEWEEKLSNYINYLKEYQLRFNKETFEIVSTGYLHDAKILKMFLEVDDKSNQDKIFQI